MRRIAFFALVTAGIVLLFAPANRLLNVLLGVVAIAAGVAMRDVPKAAPAPVAPQPKPLPKTRIETALVASLSKEAGSDLHRVVAGIIADERGKVVASNGGPIVATFASPSAAIHAAQRMLSNVDALGRRLDRFIGLSIGVDHSIEEATKLEQMTHEKRLAVLVSSAAAAGSAALAEVETGLFSFTPVQQRLF